nr:RecName: Full=Basic phospholipase A2 BjIV; Short=svPLA2; AltName: Full=Phosphatidylcholine 2-acylhydrolase [Bothrops jararacussu]
DLWSWGQMIQETGLLPSYTTY